jgi:hypothetical protein
MLRWQISERALLIISHVGNGGYHARPVTRQQIILRLDELRLLLANERYR